MTEIIKKAPVLTGGQGALAQRDADYWYYLQEFVRWLKNHLMSHECENLRGQRARYKVLMEGDWQALLEQVEKSKIPDVMSEGELHQYIKEKMPEWIEGIHREKEGK